MFLSGMLTRGRMRVKASPPAGLIRAARWWPALAWMGGIFYLSQRSTPMGVSASNAGAIVAHLGLYLALALLLYWALAGSGGDSRADAPAWVPATLAFALAVLYGVLDELHQAFVPGRTASEVDLGVDAAGALLGVTAALLAARLLNTRRQRP